MESGQRADMVNGGSLLLTLDPYRAYEESSVAGDDPVNLVVALYEGALTSIRNAKACLESGDIFSRGKAINKAINIVAELLTSLDHERGGAISQNLQGIYLYVHKRLTEAHTQQRREPLDEAESLLSTLLSGWKKVAEERFATTQSTEVWQSNTNNDHADPNFPYGIYFAEEGIVGPAISVAC